MTAKIPAEALNAVQTLRGVFPKGSTAFTINRHVSASGMTRHVSVLAVKGDDIRDVSHLVARAIGWGWDDKTGGVRVKGCGMDMHFHLVSTLAYVLYDSELAITKRGI